MAATRAAAGLVLLLAWTAWWSGCGCGGVAGQAVVAPAGPGPVPIVFPPTGLKGPASISRPETLNAGGPLSVRVEPRRPLGRATAALRGVASRLQRLVGAADGAGNLLMSPLSVAAALGQLLLGARGETRVLLADLLDAPGPTRNVPKVSLGGEVLIPDLEYHQQFKALLDLLAADDAPASASVELRVASAFFAQRGLPLRTDFQHALHDLYQADVRPLDFRERPVESAALVNEWARRASRGRIPTVLAQPLPTSTAALVASAVYFRGAWEWPFDPELTVTGWFKLNAQRRVAAKFMRGHFTDVPYHDAPGLGYRLVKLPYKGGQTAMYVVLPDDKEADLRTFAASMSLDGMMASARAARPQTLTLILPRMNIAGSFSLKEPLANLRRTRRLPRSAPQESINHILTARSEPRARAVDSQATPTAHPAESAAAPPSAIPASSAASTFSSDPAPSMHSSGTSEVYHPNSAPANNPPPVPLGSPGSPPAPSAPFYFQALPNVPSNSSLIPGYPSPEASSPSSSSGEVGKLPPPNLLPPPPSQARPPRPGQSPPPNLLPPPPSQVRPPRPGQSPPPNLLPPPPSQARPLHTGQLPPPNPLPPPIAPSNHALPSNAPLPPFNPLASPPPPSQALPSNAPLPPFNPLASPPPPSQALPSNAPLPPFNHLASPPPPTPLPPYVSPIAPSSALSPTAAPPPPPAEVSMADDEPGTGAVEMQMAESDGATTKRPTKPSAPPLNPLAVGAQGGYGLRPRPTPPGLDDIELDLTGASNATLRVSDALHHVWLEVTETGTEAVAITTTLVDYSGADQLVVVNRPFVVAIVHEPSEALLFWAAVNDPTGGAGIRTDVPQPTGAAPSPQAVARRGRG